MKGFTFVAGGVWVSGKGLRVIPELEDILAREFVKNKLWFPQFAVTYSSIIGIELSKP